MKPISDWLFFLISIPALTCTGLILLTSHAHALRGAGPGDTHDLMPSLSVIAQYHAGRAVSSNSRFAGSKVSIRLFVPLSDGNHLQVHMNRGRLIGYIRNNGRPPR